MTILVQRQFRVPAAERAEFERRGREHVWPAFLEFGVPMLAFGRWEFGGDAGVVVTHTAYEDLEHWAATRPVHVDGPGALYSDPEVTARVRALLAPLAECAAPPPEGDARLIDVDEEVSRTGAFRRRAGAEALPPPPTFGRGSVISERTYLLHPGTAGEFRRLSLQIWPWLEAMGGRLVAFGQDPLHASDEVITLFAFRSLQDWRRVSRPSADLDPPAGVVQAWNQRASLIASNHGRLLTVLTDFGTVAPGPAREAPTEHP